MTDTESTGTLAAAPVRVDVRSVEKELAGLWQRAAEGGLPGVAAPSTRVILSNIIVYAATQAEADDASRIMLDTAAHHPSRTIIADAEPGEPGKELEADVSMVCSISDLGRRLCGEEVRLHAHGITVTALGTILPVIVPDLPIYLWTPGDIRDGDPVYRQLMNIPDHWIVDSRRFSDRRRCLRTITTLGVERKPPIIVHDLAWSSLAVWRETVARHFDLKPARHFLPGIKSIEITYRPQDGKPSMESLLIAAWLISRLELRSPQASDVDGTLKITAQSDAGAVEMRLTGSDDAQTPLQSIAIESLVSGKRARFSSTRSGASAEVTNEAKCPEMPSFRSTVVLGPESRADELRAILDAPDREWIYEASLRVLAQLLS